MSASAEKILTRENPLVIGHRGYCGLAPENTLPSFGLALKAGADLIELDYRHSKDDVPMVIHDARLDRTTDARKQIGRRVRVADKTAVELRSLDAGRWFEKKFSGAKIPLLTEALDFICGNGSVALIEHKSGDARTLANILSSREWINQAVVISFDWKFLRELNALEPKQILGALGPPARLSNGRRPVHLRRTLGSRLDDLVKTGAKIAVWNKHVSKRSVQSAELRGLKTWVYTINDARTARQILKSGVTGIITDKIPVIQNLLANRRAEQS
jgi:glycerophosphoryl diester phosphodiesterase